MLNFDPRRWLADRQGQSVADVASVATSPAQAELAVLCGGAATPATIATLADRQGLLDHWCAGFNALDPLRPAPGFTLARWQTLYDCAYWWLANFARQAVRDGWRTGDVFGIRAGYPGRGGLIDQLGDNRWLVMTAGRATWRSWGTIRHWSCGACPHLPPFWEGDHAEAET